MATSYHLGVDIGASRVHAATARMTSSGNERVEVSPLASTREDMPALMWVSADGDLEFGTDAARRMDQPECVVRGLRCRVGTGVPFVVAGHRISAEDAYARLAAAVVATVSQTEGGPPDRLVVTHPAAWGSYRLAGVRAALELSCDVPVELVPEPVAAAWGALKPADPGKAWAVYDLGETSLDTAVVRRDEDGWAIVPAAVGAAPFGGVDVDDAVVGRFLTDTPASPRPARTSSAGLRLSTVAAKEVLSAEPDAVVTTHLDADPSTARLTRGDFEAMIEGLLDQTVLTLRETMDDGGVALEEISGVILVGGSSRIPLVTQQLSTALGVPVIAESDPAALLAMGAARRALRLSPSGTLEAAGSSMDQSTAPEGGPGRRRDEPAVVIPFIRPEQSRLATHAWRLMVASLIVVCVAYLAWAFTSDSSGLFGLGPSGEAVIRQHHGDEG